MALILDGRRARETLAEKLKGKIKWLSFKPRLTIVQVGSVSESSAYIRQKKLFGESVGAEVSHIRLPETVSGEELIDKISDLNRDKNVHGIIVQLPLPVRLDRQKTIDAVSPEKDADGLTTTSVERRRAARGGAALWPATARAVLELLNFYQVPLAGKKAAVLGRSALVGAPVAEILEENGVSVTVCHSQTLNTKEITRASHIVVAAVGKPRFVGADYFAAGANQIAVDVGINRISHHAEKLAEEIPRVKFVGDIDFEAVAPLVGAISPVPGGVGPMTVLALFENLADIAAASSLAGMSDI